MAFINNIWREISQNGVSLDYPEELQAKIIITNRLIIIFSALAIPFLFAFHSSLPLILISTAPIILHVFEFLLIRFGKHLFGRILFSINHPTVVALIASIAYIDIGTNGFAAKVIILATVVLPFIVFDISEKKMIICLVLYNLLFLFGFDWLKDTVDVEGISKDYDSLVIRKLALATAVIILISTLIYHQNIAHAARKRIKELLSKAEEKKEKIKSQSDFIEKKNLELEKLNSIKNRLFSIISHDLRGPTISTMSLLNLLDNDALPKEEFNTLLKSVTRNVKSNIDLLENLFFWSKSQMEGLQINPVTFKMKEIADTNIALLEAEAKQKGILVENKIAKEVSMTADMDMIKSVNRNLISNAIKYTKKGGKITLNATRINGYVEVSIADNGVGINKEDLPKIFNPAEKFSTNGTFDEKGSGFGLILCKDFIERNGVKIWAESEEGKGSVFKFTIPVTNA